MKLLAIDGNSIMNRAFYGIRLLTNKQGVYTNALTGFMNIFLKVCEDVKPDAIVAAFDLKAPTFRHKAVSTYKANRKGMPDELASQMPLIKDILSSYGVKVAQLEGYEADDILGTVSRMAEESGGYCSVLTGDRDSLQLVSDNVTVLLHGTKELTAFTPSHFAEVYGFPPINLIDLKALMGDSSDNISGVAGIGEKTASALIKEYITIENIYASLPSLNASAGVKLKLENGKTDAEQSKWLATIDRNVPLDFALSDISSERDMDRLSQILTSLEMFKLLERMKLKPSAATAIAADVSTSAALTAPKKSAEDIVLTPAPSDLTLYPLDKDALKDIEAIGSADYLLSADGIAIRCKDKLYSSAEAEIITAFLCGKIKKRTFDAKPSYRFCFAQGKEASDIVFDGCIAAYLLNSTSSEYTITRLCAEHGIAHPQNESGTEDIAALSALCDRLTAEIREHDCEKLLYEIEQPLTEVLASMEHIGVAVDKQGVSEFGDKLREELESVTKQIYEYAGHEFNIASPRQLGVVLFEELGLPHGKKTKTGYSTGVEILEECAKHHPIVPLILQYRKLSKLNSTYVEGLLKVIGGDGRIHSIFNQTETRTGRISSSEPNLQNIPVRTELGREMRRFFIAGGENVLLDADYSQIELRILAHMSNDTNMTAAFNSGEDIHTATAAQVFGMPIDMVTPGMRRSAKAVNFGIVYGIGAFSLAKDIGVSMSEADSYIKNYLANYSGVDRFMKETVAFASETGYVTTMFGRRRYIPEIKASNKNLQAFGKRAAMNAPVQGTAADIIKIAMVRVYNRLRKEELDARLILQVHDELIIEASPRDSARAARLLEEEMTGAAALSVPMPADVKSGKSWYDAKD